MGRNFPVLLLICALSFAAACSRGISGSSVEPQPSATPNDGVRRVSVEELRAALEKNEAVVVDVRGTVEYKLGHIRGARSLPLGLVKERAGELPKDKLIVAYCA